MGEAAEGIVDLEGVAVVAEAMGVEATGTVVAETTGVEATEAVVEETAMAMEVEEMAMAMLAPAVAKLAKRLVPCTQ